MFSSLLSVVSPIPFLSRHISAGSSGAGDVSPKIYRQQKINKEKRERRKERKRRSNTDYVAAAAEPDRD
jgi:hypothetical protein